MKRKYQEVLIAVFLLFLYLGIFINPNLIITSVINSLNVFKDNLFPSIFPFFLLASLTLNLGYASKISEKLSFIFKYLFHVEGACSFIIIISIISGFPSGSFYINKFYNEKLIDKKTANYLLTFTHFANPLFILGTCSIIIDSKLMALKIFIIQILANIIIGIILRFKKIVKTKEISFYNSSITTSLSNAIDDAMKLLIFMLGSITFFMFFSKLICDSFNINDFFSVIITGILDLSSGISFISILDISVFLKGLIALSFITFGSFSVHLQVINNIKNSDLSYSYFFMGRVIETGIALILFFIFNM